MKCWFAILFPVAGKNLPTSSSAFSTVAKPISNKSKNSKALSKCFRESKKEARKFRASFNCRGKSPHPSKEECGLFHLFIAFY
jgi:hypothetical protein